mgnify:CR=1 FL=1
MPNFRVSIDLCDIYRDLTEFNLRDYNLPFCLVFIEAENPDDACLIVQERIMREIIKEKDSIEGRIMCEKIKKCMRIDRIDCL